MAKKNQKLEPLTLQEIILRGDSETIRQALEARVQIDTLLEEREAAYRRIAELETQVSEIVGEDGVFPFPAPPLDVATYVQKPAPKKKVEPAPEPVVETDVTTEEAPAKVEAEAATPEETAEEAEAPKAESKKAPKADKESKKDD